MADEPDTGNGEEETEEVAEEATEEAAEDAEEEAEEEGEDEGEDEDYPLEDELEDGQEGEPGAKKGGRKKLIVIAALLLAVLGGSGGAYFLGFLDAFLGEEEKKTVAVIDLGKPVLHEFPLIKADMKTGKCKSPLLKTLLVVQLSKDDLKRLQSLELRIMDQVTQYLRDLERQEMEGRKGAEKLRFDTTRIINTLMAPSRIHAIIFKEFILQ